MIAWIADQLAKLEKRSVRFQAANQTPEHTWLNHSLIVVLLGGTLGAMVGQFVVGVDGFRVGLAVAWLLYFYREATQWTGVYRPQGWWWDATLDVLFPLWIISPLLFGPLAFYALTLAVAVMHWGVRPIE